MSQFIVLGTKDINYPQSNVAINLPDGYLLFANNGYITGIIPPTESNCVLQYDKNTQNFYWKKLSLNMVLGDKEIGEGILWNNSNGELQLMSANKGLYQIEVADNVYRLVPTSATQIILPSLVPNSILIRTTLPHVLSQIKPPANTGFLYFHNGDWDYQYPVKTAQDAGLVYWNGTDYQNVTGTTDGLHMLSKTGSSMVNVTAKDGFLVASNKDIVSVKNPTSSGEYTLLADKNGKLSWNKKETILNKVKSVTVSTDLTDGTKLTTIQNNGFFLISFDFLAQVNLLKLPSPQDDFDKFIESCPTLKITVDSGVVLLTKVFTGPMSYDYFSFTILHDFTAGQSLYAEWQNNDNIVTINNTNMTIQWVDMESDNYTVINGSSPNGILHEFNTSATVLINLTLDYTIDLLKTPANSEITINIGNQKIHVHAVPPTIYQYYSLNRIFTVAANDTITLTTNNDSVKIKNYNIIVNNITNE